MRSKTSFAVGLLPVGSRRPQAAASTRGGTQISPSDARTSWSSSDRSSRLPADWDENYRQPVLAAAGHRCQIRARGCLGKATDVDHIRRGDDHSRSNLQAACNRCHGRKSSAEGHARKRQLRAMRRRPIERHPGSR
uniref:HNH endonuclease n=1 Tax=Mycobacterium phage Stink TaxID=3136630 RepID=A0AAU8GLV7_9VIRU